MLRLTLTLCVFLGAIAAETAVAAAQPAGRAAHAVDAPHCDALSEAEAHTRALALELEVDPHIPAAARWWWGWLGTYVVAAIAQGVVGLAVEAADVRWPAVVGGASAVLAAGGVLISPARTHRLAARLRTFGALTGNARLRAVERELARAAEGEDESRNLLTHALGWGVALAGGLVLWLGFDQLVQGVLNVVVSTAISELAIATGPTSAREIWADYLARDPDRAACVADEDADESSARAPIPGATVAVRPAGLGVGLVLTF